MNQTGVRGVASQRQACRKSDGKGLAPLKAITIAL